MLYDCPVEGCHARLLSRQGLKEHRRVHTEELPYECRVKGCNLRFKWRSSEAYHVRKIHQRPEPSRGSVTASSSVRSVGSNELLFETGSSPAVQDPLELEDLLLDDIPDMDFAINTPFTKMETPIDFDFCDLRTPVIAPIEFESADSETSREVESEPMTKQESDVQDLIWSTLTFASRLSSV
uniref:C2H2-type domain-containing protein n=1 Tax=Rhodosorus marinus TaxID=101924 RepID=A0A7S3A2N5_9RHOD|mmetsp:Transcript_41590/g.163479  ORF Transcript_41590/g.163479 Transcript_41590/m.163479 type:complete len:182 (+) Transcript_41590:192-737(+)